MTKPNDNIDKITFNRFKHGDKEAFDTIYNLYSKKLYAFVYKILKTDADAKEIVQIVFIKLWEKRKKINGSELFNCYLFTIAYNASISLIRKRLSVKKYVEYVNSLQRNNSENRTIEDLDFEELNKQIQHLVDKLPAKQKEVYKLSRQDNFSYKEIAEKLNISVNTVENHISKSLAFIRKNLEGSPLT